MIITILIYVIVLLIIVIIARIISGRARPVIKDSKSTFTSLMDYFSAVYCPDKVCKINNKNQNSPFPIELIVYKDSFKLLTSESEHERESHIDESQINIMNTIRYFNYIYDDAPRSILDNFPVAENLSFSWPPKLGSRYRLTAFPYPKSTNILSAVYDTISNTVDAYTFPAWIIQRRNPLDFNNSIYNNNYFRDYQYIEVVHACYPIPGFKYPNCDDGGYWLYLATGSGVFWNTGKCVVSLNKLSLLHDLYNCSLKARREVAELNKLTKNNIQLPPVVGLSIQDIVDRLEGKGGGNSIMVAIFSIVHALTTHNFNVKIIGFKNITPSDSGSAAWDNFISRTFLILYLIAVLFIQFFVNVRNKNIQEIIILLLTCLVILAVLIYIFFFVVFEDFFRGLGWITLDMALKETNMTLYQFVEECVTGTLKNTTCNSLAMTQIFDPDTEIYTRALGYDSFILTSQPNKTGTWEVEICDLRKFDPKHPIAAGGVCGGYKKNNKMKDKSQFEYDVCNGKILRFPQKTENQKILKAGPITFDISGPPYYKPLLECECAEFSNRLCTSCDKYLSKKLCINK